MPAKKPAPNIYLSALAELELNPEECIAIEDSRNGLLSATAAGIATIVTPGIYTAGHRFDEATLVVNELSESVRKQLLSQESGGEFVDPMRTACPSSKIGFPKLRQEDRIMQAA